MTIGLHNNQEGDQPRPRHFRAPGRINIIGEHTDYNDGFVLPVNTGLYTTVQATPRDDDLFTVNSRALGETGQFRIDHCGRDESPQWLRYIEGVAAELEQVGVRISGADLVIDSDIPIGGGLSSSAALELAVGKAISGLAGADLDVAAIARVCQRAEIRHAGVNCGIMDQYSVAGGKAGAAMLLDCRTLATEFVAIPENLALVVTDSGVKHALPDSDYNDRAEECAAAVRLLQETDSTIDSLRDVSIEHLERETGRLGDVLHRRARHVISENARTLAAVTAIESGDVATLGELINASHSSLRDDYEVSCEGIETLINIVAGCDGVLGSRMVGGGFGGCVLAVTEPAATASFVQRLRTDYGKVLGTEPWVHVLTPADSAAEFEPT